MVKIHEKLRRKEGLFPVFLRWVAGRFSIEACNRRSLSSAIISFSGVSETIGTTDSTATISNNVTSEPNMTSFFI